MARLASRILFPATRAGIQFILQRVDDSKSAKNRLHLDLRTRELEPVAAAGLDDPQAMRMILLQILTGRRAREIRTCDYDCLSPAGNLAGAEGEITRFRYAQSKIDIAPDTILVDREVTVWGARTAPMISDLQ